MRFDEAEKAVRVFLIVAASDPQLELVIRYGEHPSPIFRDQFFRLKPLFP